MVVVLALEAPTYKAAKAKDVQANFITFLSIFFPF
jgi:hypothetical protein